MPILIHGLPLKCIPCLLLARIHGLVTDFYVTYARLLLKWFCFFGNCGCGVVVINYEKTNYGIKTMSRKIMSEKRQLIYDGGAVSEKRID